MLVGVGGQGTLLASRVMGRVFTAAGYDVKVSEVHGMSQRGGSVVTYVRYGEKVHSPVVEEGEADIIIAFEELEAARYLSCLKKGGRMIVNTLRIDPMPVISGVAEYPQDIIKKLEEKAALVTRVDALSLATQAGSAKAVNIVLLGVYARESGFDKGAFLEALRFCVPEKLLAPNLKAFELAFSFR
jgi:indolepyruvate ferredoxin oxidoreductase beta subunit